MPRAARGISAGRYLAAGLPKRRIAALSGIALAALAATLPPPAPPAPTLPTEGREQPIAADDFTHSMHVPLAWMNKGTAETARDCRGCHRFAGSKASSPQAECSKCHGDKTLFTMRAEPPWKTDLEANRRIARSFWHSEHAAFSCRECHSVRNKNAMDVPQHLPIPIGAEACIRCHGSGVTAATIEKFELIKPLTISTPAKLIESFVAGLNKRLTPSAQATFRHEDHLDTTDLSSAAEAKCTACHSAIKTAAVGQAGNAKFRPASCSECHLDDKGAGLALQPAKPKQRRVWTVGTFGHDDHFGFLGGAEKKNSAAAGGYEKIKSASCRHCHAFAPNGDLFDYRDFPFVEKGKHTYDGCQECHDGEAWQTKANLHGTWGTCVVCHEFGVGTMSEKRPTTEVTRLTGAKFDFRSHTHPHISSTAGNDATAKTCKKCHLRETKALPSRLNGLTFSHATHASEKCSQCHANLGGSESAKTLTQDRRHYLLGMKGTEQGCAKCHVASDIAESRESGAVAKRSALVFSHKDHLKPSTGDPLACAECHTRKGAEMTTIAPSDCTKCHGHVEDAAVRLRTADLGRAEAQSCKTCHHDADAKEAIPMTRSTETAQKPPFMVEQTVFGGFVKAQHHDTATTCDKCHKILPALTPDQTIHHLSADRKDYHSKFGIGTHQKCFGCHWRRPKVLSRWRSYGYPDPEDPELRKSSGGDLDNFPGKDAK